MNVYLDLGCYDGDTVTEFRNWSKVAFPKRKNWEIHAFDPNPNFWNRWLTLSDDNTFFHEQAAWVRHGIRTFSVENSPTPYGSSLIKSKNTWSRGTKIEVETMDFSLFLSEFEKDFVVVKIDCEGAEYAILEKMIKDGTIKIPKYLMVEFHPNKTEYTTTQTNDLIARIKGMGVNLILWH